MTEAAEITECLRRLCGYLAPNNQDSAYQLAVSYLADGELPAIRTAPDEQLLVQRIRAQLARTAGARDADKFTDCYHKIKNSVVLKQRASVLALLAALSAPQPATAPTLFSLPSLGTAAISTAPKISTSLSTLGSGGLSSGSIPTPPAGPQLTLHSAWCGSERELVRSALLAATGVRRAASGPRPALALHARAAALSKLHHKLKEFTDPTSGLAPHGLMGEGLVSALREELTEYYRSVALLQSQVCDGAGGGGTLRRVCVWAQEPLHRLTWLATITHAAHHKKGGELASCVHRFVGHGDPRVSGLARRLLTALTYPLLLMLTRWLMHGEIEDPYNEFFIESRSGVPIDHMWHDKYRVRDWMVPSFMSAEQAAQILATGKSVVFMREACADEPIDREPPAHAQYLQTLLHPPTGSEEAAWWEESGLRDALEAAHVAASRRLLLALTQHHHLMDHLLAHRRYLLLFQGDFVHHLMTLLQDDLGKPASSLYVHNLTCTLEAAVRATNAQYEPQHVLSRLHVNLFPSQPYDSGWDVFALQYRVDGPLGTLFPATSAARYRALFTQLWRIKRIEYSLHGAWRANAILHKQLKHMPEVGGLLRRVSCVRAEALRLCGALQEVGCVGAAEAAWQELLTAVREARSLDDLLHYHRAFLERAAIDAIIHHSTEELQSYLGNVLEEVLTLVGFEGTLRAGLSAELQRRDALAAVRTQRTARGEYATTLAEEAAEKERRREFHQYLGNRKADLNVLARSYRGHVKTLILKLALHAEVSLQTLAFRLDYNDFYKRGDSKLHEPLTYQHKRLSEIHLHANHKQQQSRPAERVLRRK